MRYWTYKEASDKLRLDLDLTEEDFVTENELIGYFNEGVDEAEADIHKIHEDYFLTKAGIYLIAGVSDYDLPSNIYAQKIRSFIYKNAEKIYPIRRVRGTSKFLEEAFSGQYQGEGDYSYLIRNDSSDDGYKLALLPPARETGEFGVLWYLRSANRIPLVGEAKEEGGAYTLAEVQAIVIDIPEFTPFVIQYAKCRCLEKEGDPRLETAIGILQQLRKQMVDTLTEMVVDDDTEVMQDLSHYLDHQ